MFKTVFDYLGVSAQTSGTEHASSLPPPEPEQDYNSVKCREQMSMTMCKTIGIYARDAPSQHYGIATDQCPESIEQVIDNSQKKLGATENRPCRDACSKVQKLRCGHLVYTASPTLCGNDCHDQSAVLENIGFICILCLRDEACRAEKKFPRRSYELLLPVNHEPEAERKYVGDFKDDSRVCEPAYNDPAGIVLVANHPLTATLICAWECYRENLIEQRVVNACTSLGFPKLVASLAVGNFQALLCNHQLIGRVDLAIVGAICLMLTSSFEGIELKYEDVRDYFDAPDEPQIYAYVSKGRETLTILVAREKLEKCLAKLPRKYRRDKNFDREKISEVARRIRSHALKHMGCSGRVKQALYNYIIAACIQQAMRHFKLRISMQELCEAMNLDHNSLVDPMLIKVGDQQMTKAKYTEARIRRHTGQFDWRKPVGNKKDEAKKNREKRLKA